MKKILQKFIIIDLSFLFGLLLINFAFQYMSAGMRAEVLIRAIRNDLLMADFRSVNQKLAASVNDRDFLSITLMDGKNYERGRFFGEFPFFDVRVQVPVQTNTEDQGTEVGKVTFKYSLIKGIPAFFLFWLTLNFGLTMFYTFFKKIIKSQLETQIRLEQERIQNEKLSLIARQVAHDIRAPLMALELALSDSNLAGEKKRLVENASSRIQDIANDLLIKAKDASAAQEKKTNLDLSNFLVIPALEKILKEKNSTLKNLQIDFLKKEISNESQLRLVGEENSFLRIISNLLNNSIEAMVADRNPQIQVSVSHYPNNILITVRDNGKGMPEEIMNKVGQMGFSFDKKNGNGIGLAYIKEKMTEWGGRMDISSKAKIGTMITLKFKKL